MYSVTYGPAIVYSYLRGSLQFATAISFVSIPDICSLHQSVTPYWVKLDLVIVNLLGPGLLGLMLNHSLSALASFWRCLFQLNGQDQTVRQETYALKLVLQCSCHGGHPMTAEAW